MLIAEPRLASASPSRADALSSPGQLSRDVADFAGRAKQLTSLRSIHRIYVATIREESAVPLREFMKDTQAATVFDKVPPLVLKPAAIVPATH